MARMAAAIVIIPSIVGSIAAFTVRMCTCGIAVVNATGTYTGAMAATGRKSGSNRCTRFVMATVVSGIGCC